MALIDDVKFSLRIDGTEEDENLQSLIDDAKMDIKHSTGITIIDNDIDDFQKTTVIIMVKLSNGDFDSDPRAKESLEKSIERRLFKIAHCYTEGEV